MLKWFASWLMVSLMTLFALPVGACGAGTAVVSGKVDYPPLSWNNKGQLEGIAYAVLTQILREKHIELKVYPPLPWKRSIMLAESGEIDLLVTIRETPELKHQLTFVPTPLLSSAQSVFFLKGTPIARQEDLIGKIGGAIRGDHFDGEFNTFARQNLSFQVVSHLEQNIGKLERSRIQYFIAPLLPTLHYMNAGQANAKKISTDIRYMTRPLFTTNEMIAISKKSACLDHVNYLNTRLIELHNDGTIDRLLEEEFLKWTNISHIIQNVSQKAAPE